MKKNVLSRDRLIIGQEIDIYLTDFKIGIEVGGWYWHKSRVIKDAEKYNLCRQRGIRLITIYEGFDGDADTLEIDKNDLLTYAGHLGYINMKEDGAWTCIPSVKETFIPVRTLARHIKEIVFDEDDYDCAEICLTFVVED